MLLETYINNIKAIAINSNLQRIIIASFMKIPMGYATEDILDLIIRAISFICG